MPHIPRLCFLALAPGLFLPGSAFASGVSFTQNTIPGTSPGLLHADLNHDGREDFISPRFNGNGFTVQLSTADARYAPAVTYPAPSGAIDDVPTVVADIDEDGQPDIIAVGGTASGQAFSWVYHNNGDGSFTRTGTLSMPGVVLAGDFNHDGHTDLVATLGLAFKIWFGTGGGAFTEGPTTQTTVSGNYLLGDFDGDGMADIAIGDVVNYDSFEVFYGDNQGNFTPRVISVSGGHSLFGVADVNSDGKMDIVYSTFYPTQPQHIGVYYGDAARAFSSHTTMHVSHCASNAAVPFAADMNGDGINDLVVPEASCPGPDGPTRYIGVLTRNPDATYNPDQIVYTAPASSQGLLGLAVLRLNRDDRPDLAAAVCTGTPCGQSGTMNVQLLRNTSYGNFHLCDAPKDFTGIWVCSPSSTSASSPVDFSIGASGPVLMRKVEVWVDGHKMGEQLNGFSGYSFFDKSYSIGSGSHQVDIYAAGWDNSLQRKSFTLAVH